MVATDNVAVNVKEEPAFSAIEDADDVNVTVGALSFSVIVIVTCCVPSSLAEDPVTAIVSISITAVSFPSYVLSSVGVNDTVPVKSPAEITISSILPLPSV